MALRQQVWVDRSVQGVLVGRVLLYWLCALLYVGIGSACFQYNQNPEWTLAKHAIVLFGQMWPWLPTAVLVLPLAIYDVARLSNLFVGPVYRLRKHFGALRQDIACAPLTFREDDYWRDLAAPINDMQAEILRLRTGVIELQQVASQTSALLANFKASLPDEQPAIDLASVSERIPSSATDSITNAQEFNPAAEAKSPHAAEIAVADSESTSASNTVSQTNAVAEAITSAAISEATSDQNSLPPAEVSIAPIPIATSTQSALGSSAAPAV